MKNHKRAGFTLLEVAITLIILGILAGAAIPSVIRYKQHSSLIQTKEHQEMVARAVAAYELANRKLPCPADPAAQGEYIGISRNTCEDNHRAKGIVPYKTLGLPATYARDGYKRYFTYIVPANFARENICALNPAAPLQVLDQNGPVHDHLNYIALIILSHGPKGHGAYSEQGHEKLLTENAAHAEQINADDSLTYYALPYSQGTNKFRHSTYYVTRDFLRTLSKHPCQNIRQGARNNPHVPGDQDQGGNDGDNPFD